MVIKCKVWASVTCLFRQHASMLMLLSFQPTLRQPVHGSHNL